MKQKTNLAKYVLCFILGCIFASGCAVGICYFIQQKAIQQYDKDCASIPLEVKVSKSEVQLIQPEKSCKKNISSLLSNLNKCYQGKQEALQEKEKYFEQTCNERCDEKFAIKSNKICQEKCQSKGFETGRLNAIGESCICYDIKDQNCELKCQEEGFDYGRLRSEYELGSICSCFHDTQPVIAYKPIIYLYPEYKTQVSIVAGKPERFTHTYPHYTDGWKVLAEPNGDLTDLRTGRHLYALYWEGRKTEKKEHPTDGFIVKGKDTIAFLEEKLALLGLNEREADEFIIYWLPKLEENDYNFIRFQTLDEQNANQPLNITPKPNTLIRVMMEYDDLDSPIDITEQKLPPLPKRTGFTVVEWGGTEIDI